ncbi:hypothetical protein NP233_g10346 [Leucocoprinus birnbaumii]|uniref:Uncharacterized protein n=1 Tax=Leucocoprinus birnbaumii TaxID=56174 RepID=A0AAD5YM89_9AGAR|nr:hypothetical protein NP233_g10346 [Leucocoprinus birnbaumii]
MMAQANDGLKEGWFLDGEQPLKKKGVGQGIYQSDVICPTVGWIKKASETMEYGKNYEGYWNGEKFVKQLCEKIIPESEASHGPGYQALILVDNSQGHCAYAEDALIASRMNLKPSGKQARLRNGWYFNELGEKVIQSMIFLPDHQEFPNQLKGMKQVLQEQKLWQNGLLMHCQQCPNGGTDCCAWKILQNQPDFISQKFLVQEVIEDAGHICLILPKFHCELNIIEYFWGSVKRWLCEHCDYTFSTLQKNMPTALKSVDVILIRKWQNRMFRWLDAYRGGLSAHDAHFHVQAFSSRRYTLHRRIPDNVAGSLD